MSDTHRHYPPELFKAGISAPAVLLVFFAVVSLTAAALAADREANADAEFKDQIRPLLTRYCGDCHMGDVTEADVDFGAFQSLSEVRKQTDVWLKVRGMLDSSQMPPKESPQPADQERKLLRDWVRSFLTRQAEAAAGDPGPLVLRRLNNAEYNYSVRDLTGVASLDPTREFPVDGAAGEGFINTGAAQAMSPAFVTKYLDAAKEVASHAVLLPDGIAFSEGRSRRQWIDERLQAIRRFYDKFTVPTEVFVEVGGTGKVANQGGAIPLVRYLAATLHERNALASGRKTVADVAGEQSLNARYLAALWQTLTAPNDESRSPLLELLREKWRNASPADAASLAEMIEQAQQQLWKFNSIGQLTDGGKQKTWMTPVSPIVTQQQLRLPAPKSTGGSDMVVYLSAGDLGDGRDGDFVVWGRPRLEFKADASGFAHPPILLRDVAGLVERIEKTILSELPRTSHYLDAVAQTRTAKLSIDEIARSHALDAQLLKQWSELVGLARPAARDIRGRFTSKLTAAHGYADVNGWGAPQTPSALANRSREDISFSTLTVPARGVVVHPSPIRESTVAWRSPLDGKINVEGLVADADDKCGNGAAWRVELMTEAGTRELAGGVIDNGGGQHFQSQEEIAVRQGDVVSLIVSARDKNHVCDTTHIELTLTEIAGNQRKWDLAGDVVDRILDANPLPDSYGNADVWHFGASEGDAKPESLLIPGSTLAHWRAAVLDARPGDEIARLATLVQDILTKDDAERFGEADRKLRAQLTDWKGPLRWTTVAQVSDLSASDVAQRFGDMHPPFGLHPNGSTIDAASLCVQAPRVLTLQLPAALAAEAEFVVSAELHAATAADGSVQVQISQKKPASMEVSPSLPLLVSAGGAAKDRLQAALAEFRNLFPPALCYSRIVPVDEVVTLTLYFREDEHLQRLMLTEAQSAELHRLWDELFFVAQAPIALTVAFEQIYEFATQDRPDLVKAFGPMRKPINDRADVFRQRLKETEPAHLDAVIEFAARAWRRPLTTSAGDNEEAALRDFYNQLRESGIAHEQSLRLAIARVLTSPAFLYRREQPAPGADAAPVTSNELATRLSYFLWSSLPDAKLREVADSGRLLDDEVLREQTQRMLKHPRTRRLAIQFACQWLHLRDFDQNDDKNEQLYPQFAALRSDMYEETVRFFEDMFQNDGSILDLVDADHTFLNEALAGHYGIAGVQGPAWRRVEGVRNRGRGGVFGMASLLASQSGASRTSPILRGNWVYETLLGQRLPRPPANVPQLPESVPAGLSARQLIEKHSSVPACAKCHAKIDPFGFALEQYDAIGRLRAAAVDTSTKLEDGTKLDGIDGLRSYLLTQRRDDVVRQFCRKLLGFALGRETQLSDEILLNEMQRKLQAGDYRFSVAANAIVASDQFRKIRGAQAIDGSQNRTGDFGR